MALTQCHGTKTDGSDCGKKAGSKRGDIETEQP